MTRLSLCLDTSGGGVGPHYFHWLIASSELGRDSEVPLQVGSEVCAARRPITRRPHRSKWRRAHHPRPIYTARRAGRPHNARGRARSPQRPPPPLARGTALSLFSLFSVRLSLADAVALRPMRAPPCRAASWPKSGRRLRRPSRPTSPTRRSTWSARGAAGAPRPPPPRRGPLLVILSPLSSTTVSTCHISLLYV